MTLLDLLACEVRTESGAPLGRVWDVRAEAVEGGYRLVGLLVGPGALFERLGLHRLRDQRRHGEPTHPRVDLVSWESVLRLEAGIVVVGDGVRPQRV